MAIFQLNHAVLFVRDLTESVAFYRDVLGFSAVDLGGLPGAAFLRAPDSTNDHDLGLFEVPGAGPSYAGRSSVGLYHLAWEVDTLDALESLAGRLAGADALVGMSDHGTTKSLYGRDPNGIEFEIVWIVPAALLTDADREARRHIGALDLGREIERFGRVTRGGVGVSHHTPSPVSAEEHARQPGCTGYAETAVDNSRGADRFRLWTTVPGEAGRGSRVVSLTIPGNQ
jgi:catechol 2,3-dioxygenase-like lactoylglutathione lyase family enzyme